MTHTAARPPSSRASRTCRAGERSTIAGWYKRLPGASDHSQPGGVEEVRRG
jgi:hypothetical protein